MSIASLFFKYTKNPQSVSVHSHTVTHFLAFGFACFHSNFQFPCEHHRDPHIQNQINPFITYLLLQSQIFSSLFVRFPLNIISIPSHIPPLHFLSLSWIIRKKISSLLHLLLLSDFSLLIPDSHFASFLNSYCSSHNSPSVQSKRKLY